VNIGLALAPMDGNLADLLMLRAAVALYRAKAEHGPALRFAEPPDVAVVLAVRKCSGVSAR